MAAATGGCSSVVAGGKISQNGKSIEQAIDKIFM
jgi:hypothetical protein